MQIKKRGTDVKRHTISYLVGGKWRTRSEVYNLAREGRVAGVTACRSGRNRYVQSLPGHTNLYDLPIKVN